MAEEKIIITHRVKVKDENDKFVKDENGRFVWKEIATEYRVDADFVPTRIDEICNVFIDNYCEANDKGAWLLKTLEKTETVSKGKNKGKEKPISFVGLRAEFAKEFFPNIIVGKDETPTFIERMRKKYGNQ